MNLTTKILNISLIIGILFILFTLAYARADNTKTETPFDDFRKPDIQDKYYESEGEFKQILQQESEDFYVNTITEPPCKGYEIVEKYGDGTIETTTYGCKFQMINHEIETPIDPISSSTVSKPGI